MAVIKSGVPPELILGLLLFNIFIHDLHNSTDCTVISFASNTNLNLRTITCWDRMPGEVV